MKHLHHPSPAQIRARAAQMFALQQRAGQASAPASTRPPIPPLRAAAPGETPLSPAEVAHGVYHQLIGSGA